MRICPGWRSSSVNSRIALPITSIGSFDFTVVCEAAERRVNCGMIVANRFGSDTSSQSARATTSKSQCCRPMLRACASPRFSSRGTIVTSGTSSSGRSAVNHTAMVDCSVSKYRCTGS